MNYLFSSVDFEIFGSLIVWIKVNSVFTNFIPQDCLTITFFLHSFFNSYTLASIFPSLLPYFLGLLVCCAFKFPLMSFLPS